MAEDKRYQQLNEGVYNAALAAASNNQGPAYSGAYEEELNRLYDQIQNREQFSYDATTDPLYQAYKDQYIQGGKLAMKDTMGQAAALTGGYGSSYGQQVGQQAYNAYLQNLSAVIPELYGQAYDMYKDEGDNLKDLWTMTGQRREADYNKWRDEMSDWQRGQELAAALETEQYNRQTAADERAYTRQQQAYQNLVASISSSGYTPSDAELKKAGMSRGEANALKAEYNRQVAAQQAAAAGRGSGGGGGGGGRAGSAGNSGSGSNLGAYQVGLNMAGLYGQGAAGIFANSLKNGQADGLTTAEKRSIYQGIVDGAGLAFFDK